MLTIRLTRKGKKNQPFFRIVVIDKRRSTRGGRAVEELGYVNPLTKKNSINKERALHWLGVGAQPSPRIHNLFVSEKIVDKPKINTFKITKKARTAAAVPAPVASAPAGAPAPEVSAPTEATAPTEEVKVEPAPVEAPVETPVAEAPKEEPKPEPAPTPEAPKEEPKVEEKTA